MKNMWIEEHGVRKSPASSERPDFPMSPKKRAQMLFATATFVATTVPLV
jgi:hypothetical protein